MSWDIIWLGREAFIIEIPTGTCIVNPYCQFSQVCTNFMQTYHIYINDQFALANLQS